MKKICIYIAFLPFIVGIISCNEFTEGFTEDPVNPTEVDNLSVLLTGVEVNLMGTLEGELARNAGMWARSFTGVQAQYASLENYSNVTASTYDGPWGNIYDNTLINIKYLKRGAIEQKNFTLLGIAQVMEAQLMGTATALFGDIPFSEAGRFPEIQNPKFDKQSEVYAGVQLLLDSAIANLQIPSAPYDVSHDIFASANKKFSWLKTAYTLKARFYLHTKNWQAVIDNAGQGIWSSEANMVATHGNAPGANLNIYYDFVARQRLGYMDASASHTVELLKERGEVNRLSFYFSGNNLNVSNTGFFAMTASFPLVSYEENILAFAEAQARLGNLQVGLDSLNSYRAYVASRFEDVLPPLVLPDQQTLLKQILEERYISLTGQIEVYNDVRRAPDLIAVTPVTGTQIPQRFLWAQIEVNSNPNIPRPLPGLFEPTEVFKD